MDFTTISKYPKLRYNNNLTIILMHWHKNMVATAYFGLVNLGMQLFFTFTMTIKLQVCCNILTRSTQLSPRNSVPVTVRAS